MLYVTAVILLAVFLGGFLFFICYATIEQISSSIATQMGAYSGMSSYGAYELASVFMNNLWKLLLVLMLLGVAYWVYIYSQHKGAGVAYE